MKKAYQKFIHFFVLISLVLTLSLTTGCYGRNVLFKKLHRWNGTIGNKFVRSLAHFALWVFPLYQVCLFLDVVLFNVIEFWTGSNPIAMNEGEVETQIVHYNEKSYQITATKNTFTITNLTSNEVAVIQFVPEETSWYVTEGDSSRKLIEFDPENPHIMKIFNKNGAVVSEGNV